MTTLISCCNEALSQIAAGQIATLTEGSIEARECQRFAPTLLGEVAQWTDWSFQRVVAALAEVFNPRPAEWLHAYSPPTDMASPIAVRAVEDDARSLPSLGPTTFPLQDIAPLRFLYEGGVIFTNVPSATLHYVRAAIDLASMPPLLRRAFIVELAARIALPIKKDAKLAQVLSQQAMMARNEAIAAEENKAPRRQVEYISDAEWARLGVDDGYSGGYSRSTGTSAGNTVLTGVTLPGDAPPSGGGSGSTEDIPDLAAIFNSGLGF